MTTHSQSNKAKGYVLTYNPQTNKNEFLKYTERSVHTKHGRMYYVETRSGYNIKVTDDHSLATVGTDSFFSPLPPQDSLHKFVPIAYQISYPIDKEESSRAIEEMTKDIIKESGGCFKEYMLELELPFVASIVLILFTNSNTEKLEYTCKSQEELDLAKLILARIGLIPEFKGFTISVDPKREPLVPEDGKLISRSEAEKLNPANPYLNLPFTWDEVIEVTEIPREDVTYDFTVPEFPLFIANGILVYDTMQLHVPATEEARVEALDKMLPSKNLFSPRTMGPMMLPQQESVFGIFRASQPVKTFTKDTKFTTVMDPDKLYQDVRMDMIKPNAPVIYKGHKTTAGLVLVNELLPVMMRKYDQVWDKSVMTRTLSQIGKQNAPEYTKIADGLKDLGALFAYKLGVSYKATDFDLDGLKKKRDVYFKKVDKELAAIDKKNLPAHQAEEEKNKVLRRAQAFAQKLTDEATDNTFQQWAYTGSKGSKSQVMQIITSPTVVADPKNRMIPLLIHKSYTEGLSPSDYWISSYGTRKGTVGAKLSVAPAGALSKELIGNVLDVVVSMRDCGTKRGVTRDIEDAQNIINRVEVGTNKFIDANYYEMLKKRGVKQVIVRSPATCEARDGVCQYCYGYNEKLKFPDIGENVGVVSAHALAEPFIQLGLSAKHTAGTASGDTIGLNTIKSFLNMSTKFSGAAVISEVTGTVTRVEKAPAGGTNVYIGKKKYYIPPTRPLKVKLGDHISAGTPLTDGILNMSKIVPYKGIDQGRSQFVNSMSKLYEGAGVDALKKNFEVVSRGLINYVQITDPGDFDDLIEGDVVDYNQLMADIRKNPTKKKPTFIPFQKGTNKAPTYKKDWLANFGFKYLKGELIENAATHATSPLHSYHPIPSYARGVGFGRGKDGRY